MPAAAPVAHARSKDPSGSPASATATEMNMELLYRSPGTTHINGPGWNPVPEGAARRALRRPGDGDTVASSAALR